MRQRSAGRFHLPLSGASVRASLILSFAVAIGVLFFGRGNQTFDGVRLALERGTGTVYEFLGPPIATGRSFIGNLLRVFEVYRENGKLRVENAKLKAWQAQAIALQQKVTRYEALLAIPQEPGIQYRTGRILDDPGGPFVQTFRINLGTKDGVVEGQGVMDERGFIGRVVAAGKTASRVLLITDLNSRVPVAIEPSGTRGMLIGQNDGLPMIAFLPRGARIAPGDHVVTSGNGGLFPPNIPVGIVRAVRRDQVWVQPATDFASVDYVRVLEYTSPVAEVPYSTSGPPILNSKPEGAPAAPPVETPGSKPVPPTAAPKPVKPPGEPAVTRVPKPSVPDVAASTPAPPARASSVPPNTAPAAPNSVSAPVEDPDTGGFE